MFNLPSVQFPYQSKVPNKIWVSDITYIKTGLGWYYLAAVMDLYNREVIGYSTSKNIDTETSQTSNRKCNSQVS